MKKMEGGDQNLGNGGGSRWNPTKEQIDMLESLYKQGLRTPTAEQIQQITTCLRAFGHIEGKNVFYWFQNHKARQRQKQKQKQETFAYYNRFLHAPLVFPPYHNVVCSPCYIPPVPKNDPVFYQHYPNVQLPTAAGSFNRSRLIPESTYQTTNQNPTCTQRSNTKSMDDLQFISSTKNTSSHRHETLNLFPIHPTGILQSRSGTDHGHDNKNPRTACANTPSISSGAENDDDDDGHPFYDFFCGK